MSDAPSANDGAPAASGRRHHLTPLGSARRFVDGDGRDVRYVRERGQWIVWNGRCWQEDDGVGLQRRAKETVLAMYREAETCHDHERNELVRHAQRSESLKALTELTKLAISEAGVAVRVADLDPDPWLLGCQNETLDLKTGGLRPHRREDLITRLVPVDYDADAACPRWEAFLDRAMAGDADLVGYLQRAAGYALTGDASEQALFFLVGDGANGKSTFLETLGEVLGPHAVQADASCFLRRKGGGPRNDLARLAGARLVAAAETESDAALAEAMVKMVTGGERIAARFLYHETFEYAPTFKLFLATNHLPRIAGTDEGIWRRLRVVRFGVTIPERERDKRLREALRAELPGILSWAVRGCLEWQRAGGLGEPVAVVAANAGYRAEMDGVGRFLAECCVRGEDRVTPMGDLFTGYQAWCAASGEEPLPKYRFGNQLTRHGLAAHRGTRGVAVRLGVGLRRDVSGRSAGVGAEPAPVRIDDYRVGRLERAGR